MAFVKLDTGILDSTLWFKKDQRDVFLTAMLMAVPRELKEPTPQLQVDTLDGTGFTVPPGWYGFVSASGPGILHRAMVAQGPGMDALKSLGEPELESRSQDYEGRRVVRVDGGYIVLNYMRFRDHDYAAADRMRNLRLRRKKLQTQPPEGGSDANVRRNGVGVQTNVTYSREQIAEAREEQEQGSNIPDSVDARILCEELGIFKVREQVEMHACYKAFCSTSKLSVEAAREHMKRRWGEYQTFIQKKKLEWSYGSAFAFFMSGVWNDSELWPKKISKGAAALDEMRFVNSEK